MDYKRRSTRNTSEPQGTRKNTLFVLVSVAMIAIILLATVGKSCSCTSISNLFGKDKTEQNDRITDTISQQEQELLSPAPSVSASESTLVLASKVFYILQMGQYDDLNLANAQAAIVKPMGAAGYVKQDGQLHRVFAAVYGDEKSLQKVLDQVRSEGHDASSYITATDELTINISGNVEQNEFLLDAVKLVNGLYDELSQMSIAFDMGELTAIQCKAKINLMNMDIGTASDAIITNDSTNVQYIHNYISDCQEILSTFQGVDGTMSVGEFSSELKALIFKIIDSYIGFISNSNGGIDNETS